MFSLSGILGFFTGGWKWFLAIAVVAGLAFTAGFYNGSTHEAKIMANAAVTAADQARSQQQKKDSAEWARAKADADKRHDQDQASNEALRQLVAKGPTIIVKHVRDPLNPTVDTVVSSVSKQSMSQLNDPALVGETQ